MVNVYVPIRVGGGLLVFIFVYTFDVCVRSDVCESEETKVYPNSGWGLVIRISFYAFSVIYLLDDKRG